MYIIFNQICINEEMLPRYTYFKLHDPAAHKYKVLEKQLIMEDLSTNSRRIS